MNILINISLLSDCDDININIETLFFGNDDHMLLSPICVCEKVERL